MNAFILIFVVLIGVTIWNVAKEYRRRNAATTALARRQAEEQLGPEVIVEALSTLLAEGGLDLSGAERVAAAAKDQAVLRGVLEIIRLALSALEKDRAAKAYPGNPIFREQAREARALALAAARKTMKTAAQTLGLPPHAYKEQVMHILSLTEKLKSAPDTQTIDGILS